MSFSLMKSWRLLALFVTVSHASHEWSSADVARSAAQADRLEIGATYSKSFSHHATALREHLLSSYDKSVPPPSNRTNEYSAAGVDVAMQLRFFKVESVMAASGDDGPNPDPNPGPNPDPNPDPNPKQAA